MSSLQAIFLGLLQGLTEFLPVSSSGHLVIAQHLFSLSRPPVIFDISLHLATALVVVIVMWPQLKALTFNQLKLLIVASLPAAFFGFLLNSRLESLFSSLTLVGFTLITTSLLLFSTRLIKTHSSKTLTAKPSFIIGLFQALAILPGISRSGSTIVAGLFQGLSPTKAFNFSFLLSLPAILGAQLLHFKDLSSLDSQQLPLYLSGFLSAFVSGYFALKILRQTVIKGKLRLFGYYCLILGSVVLLASLRA